MKKLSPKDLLKMLNERDDVYCHVSTRIFKDNFFQPRIPDGLETYAQEENDDIDRVCVSSTLEGAFQAIPQGGTYLYNWYEDNALYFKIYIIDTLKLGIKKENIYTPNYLVENNYVQDALRTGEHWILESFKVPEEYSFLIKLKDWQLEEEGEWEYSIKSLDIITEFVKKGEEIEIDLDYIEEANFWLSEDDSLSIDIEKEQLKDFFLRINPEIEFIDTDEDEKIIMLSKKDQNIKRLMEFDSVYKSYNILRSDYTKEQLDNLIENINIKFDYSY